MLAFIYLPSLLPAEPESRRLAETKSVANSEALRPRITTRRKAATKSAIRPGFGLSMTRSLLCGAEVPVWVVMRTGRVLPLTTIFVPEYTGLELPLTTGVLLPLRTGLIFIFSLEVDKLATWLLAGAAEICGHPMAGRTCFFDAGAAVFFRATTDPACLLHRFVVEAIVESSANVIPLFPLAGQRTEGIGRERNGITVDRHKDRESHSLSSFELR
jgi:hypothetical protein